MNQLLVLFKGGLVGIANIIPGVSGCTFALVLGIYERLLAAIGAFGLQTAKALGGLLAHPASRDRRRAFAEEMRRTDTIWLGILAVGALGAILASSRLIASLLENHLSTTLAFFVGLIVPSILVPYRLLDRRSWREFLACVLATVGLVGLTLIQPDTGAGEAASGDLVGLFVAGAIAISAMILPGVSGSFVLMVMGEYKNLLDAINNMAFARLGVFALGCLVGILAFVKLLNFLLKRFRSVTMAFLIGLILGSLWVLWPFKQLAPGAKIITGINVLPTSLSPEVGWAIGSLLAGLICSAGVMWIGRLQTGVRDGEGD